MEIVDTKFRESWPALRRHLRHGRHAVVRHTLGFGAWRLTHGLPRAFQPREIPRTFFGVNCAPNPDPAWDETYLQWLTELGVGSVRVDAAAWDTDPEPFWRWVTALHARGFDVVAHLVQRPAAAAMMPEFSIRQEWETFVRDTLTPVRGAVSHVEVGSTPNRHTWSGNTVIGLAHAHETARPILNELGLRAVGPNVQDFAPYFSAASLGEMRARGVTPHVHSDNLFVDRAGVPPERPDHRAMGRPLSPMVRFTLVRKLQWLAALSQWAGCEETWVTCFAWTVARSERAKVRHVDPQTQANFLSRYILLAAASGLVTRVFWDQLTGHLRGLIDDGHPVRYNPPEVFLRRLNHTCPSEQAKRPAFHALAELTRQLVGSRVVHASVEAEKIRLTFEKDDQRCGAVWNVAQPDGVDDLQPRFSSRT